MKPILLLFVFSTLLSCGCKKDSEPTRDEDPDGSVRIAERIYRHKVGDQLVLDTLDFQYDEAGRVTRKENPRAHYFEEYAYDAKGHAVSMKGTNSLGTTNLMNFAVYSANEDTILLDFSRPDISGNGNDTIQLTYIYDHDLVTEYWTYLHNPDGFRLQQKEGFVYDAGENLSSTFFETLTNPRTTTFEVLEWDDKINPRHGQPKLNHLLLDAAMPLQSFSLHNPIRYKNSSGVVYDYEFTYNAAGYPLTIKNKQDDFIMLELIYAP